MRKPKFNGRKMAAGTYANGSTWAMYSHYTYLDGIATPHCGQGGSYQHHMNFAVLRIGANGWSIDFAQDLDTANAMVKAAGKRGLGEKHLMALDAAAALKDAQGFEPRCQHLECQQAWERKHAAAGRRIAAKLMKVGA
jgi:hypothetical protein